MRSGLLTLLAVLALALLVACGIPGAPQPPSLELPRTVQNLSAVRKGNHVTLMWTTPRETTDRTHIKHLGSTRICRAVDQVAVVECVGTVGTLPPERTPLANAATFTDTLPSALQAAHETGFATYAVQVENTRGRSAGLSNQVTVPLAPTLPPPDRISASVTSEGVRILTSGYTWPGLPSGLDIEIHLYRRSQRSANEVDLGGPLWRVGSGFGQSMEFLDRTAEWEQTYLYKVAGVTVEPVQGVAERVEGDASQEIEVFVHDIFPPAVPTGLQAVFTETPQQSFIDLSWTPDTESDLAGYNVYRHEEGTQVEKISSEIVRAPAYRDTHVHPGHHYFYSVSAVDVRGNESARSEDVSEAVPQ